MLTTIKYSLQRHSKYLLYDRLNFLQRLTVILLTIILFAIAPNARSTSFTIADGVFVTSQQTLSSNETGTINSGGDLSTGLATAIYADDSSTITVLNNGAITTSGNNSIGIYSRDNSGTSTFTSSGTIRTTGEDSFGIFSYANGGTETLTNSGTITTTGYQSSGIQSQNNSGTETITNSGTITTSGSLSGYGIYSVLNSGTSTILNSDTITTSGNHGYGVYSYLNSDTVNFTNSGAITTSGANGYGIHSNQNSDASTFTNSGTITTTGASGHGFYSLSNSGTETLTNSGTIKVTGSSAVGVKSNRAITINNTGLIWATSNASKAIETTGSYNDILNIKPGSVITGTVHLGAGTDVVNVTATNSESNLTVGGSAVQWNLSTAGIVSANTLTLGSSQTVTQSGTFSTSVASGYGMYLNSSANAALTNSGGITTSGANSYGIYANASSGTSTFTNSGTITTSGASGHGIYSVNNSGATTLTNSGTINVTGSGAVGIKINRAGTITNSGTISATGDATQAIVATGNYDNTLNLLSGSNITGTIDLGGGTDTVNISGTQNINGCQKAPCMSASLFTNAETINIASDVEGVVISGGLASTVDPTGSSVLGVSLSTMTSAVHDVVSQRMARTRTPGIPAGGRGLSSWGQTIGAYRSRGTEGSAMGHNHSYVGFTGGMEKQVKQGRVGVIGGFANSGVSTKTVSNSTNTNSFFGGIYGDLHLGRQVSLTTSLLGGYEYHDNTRSVSTNVAGLQDAKSDFSSVFFSPSVTLSSTHPFEIAGRQFAFRPSTTAVYTISQYDNYQEKGTTGSNLAVSDRTVQALKIRAQLAVALALNKHSEFELRSGFVTRHTDHDDIRASLGSTSFRFAGAGNNSVQGGFVGGSLRLHATKNLRASVDVKFRGAGSRESEFIGRAGIGYSF